MQRIAREIATKREATTTASRIDYRKVAALHGFSRGYDTTNDPLLWELWQAPYLPGAAWDELVTLVTLPQRDGSPRAVPLNEEERKRFEELGFSEEC